MEGMNSADSIPDMDFKRNAITPNVPIRTLISFSFRIKVRVHNYVIYVVSFYHNILVIVIRISFNDQRPQSTEKFL